jgi:NADH-quinone oxidoreductase subunit C
MEKIFNPIINITPILLKMNYRDSEFSIVVLSKNLYFVLNVLKNHIGSQFNLLACISGTDLLTGLYRYMVTYELLSIINNSRIRVKVFLKDSPVVDSIVKIFINANWWEREIWDLYGIYFNNHPDLRRILTDYGFEGHPLRKDFPLSGFKEVRYNQKKNTIDYSFTQLSQEYRVFNYEMPW